jgi:hypothetical protein
MKDGVKQSCFFILFLSAEVMGREFVHLEVREAIRLKKRLLLLHEADPRFNAVDFGKERSEAPDDLKV